MILLKKVRLVNWYGFSHETAPIGFFTLIAGKNGNGKSVFLDAVKYAAYGDTVFNKSSESKGSRTLSSYTRGLLDATAGTYMRPAERVPNVYSHIVLEFWDDVEEKTFLLGAVIETSASNNCQTYRYAVDHMTMEEMNHTYREDDVPKPYSASMLQKEYKLKLMNREQGLPKFMQMTGLRLGLNQIPTYLRKLRGIMSYDPNAKIDRFIRESVLEERNVDFGKLIEAKNNISQLNDNFDRIQQEIEELDGILEEYDAWETETNRLLADDIRIVYKKQRDLSLAIDRQTKERDEAELRRENIASELEILAERQESLSSQLVQARVSLNQLDSTRLMEEEKRRLADYEAEAKELQGKCRKLEHFQTVISEMLARFFPKTEPIEKREVLVSLCQHDYDAAEKASAVALLQQKVDQLYDDRVGKMAQTEQRIEEMNRALDAQNQIIEESRKHRNTYAQIPDYVGLRDEINREFEKRKITSKARFACEYVVSLKDESWRDAVEAFLGRRRYTILVEPQVYDIADDVLNRSEYRYAHLFNTKLLMRKSLKVEEDSVVDVLEIKNPVAKQYFEYQLGRMHAVELRQVREHENAISREGRVSVAMDSYFLRFDRIESYYLGQRIYELNRKRAEREIDRLMAERKELLAEKKDLTGQKEILAQNRAFFVEYDYDAHSRYQTAAQNVRESKAQIQRMEAAQKHDREFMELSEQVGRLSDLCEAQRKLYEEKLKDQSGQDVIVRRCEEQIEAKTAELEIQKERFAAFQVEYYALVRKTVEAYEKFVENGETGPGGPVAEASRKRMLQRIEQYKGILIQRQADYNAKHSGYMLPAGTEGRDQYAVRREKIWMDNLQEIRRKLEEQTRHYEDIFKNEFVLTIYKSCERAREELRQMNGELAKLHFSSRYQFDVHYVGDGSEYAKIIEYARFLDEREQLGGGTQGQMTLGMMTSVSDEEGEQLEREMQRIVNHIIEQNSEETIARFADYRNYMTYEILLTNQVMDRARLSRQTGYNSGAEVQIPYLLILSSALLMIYNQHVNSTRLVFIDEPFAKMDPGNVKLMLDFMREQKMQVIFCSPDKTESIGNECEVILPALRVRPDNMRLGIVQFHEEKAYGRI